MSTSTSRAGVLRGVLVGACSALFTAAAHTAAGGLPTGTPLLLLALLCGTVGAVVSAVTVERFASAIATLTTAVVVAQSLGHLALSAAPHHHAPMGATMLAAHILAALALAVLIALTEFLYRICGSVLCWLRLVLLYQGRPQPPAAPGRVVVIVRPVLLRPGLGMRAPPVGTVTG
ncbi:MAG: hypothetical protein K0R68_1714 [Mycobacterium sp.]|nr:hypothetical protein [Mycobacterium sp.]